MRDLYIFRAIRVIIVNFLVQGTQDEVQHHTRRFEKSDHIYTMLCGERSHSQHNLWIANGRGERRRSEAY